MDSGHELTGAAFPFLARNAVRSGQQPSWVDHDCAAVPLVEGQEDLPRPRMSFSVVAADNTRIYEQSDLNVKKPKEPRRMLLSKISTILKLFSDCTILRSQKELESRR
jgi:hypothetical protein